MHPEQPVSPADDAPPPLRASDADRAETVRALQDAVARGLLTHDEGSERMSAQTVSPPSWVHWSLDEQGLPRLMPAPLELPPQMPFKQ